MIDRAGELCQDLPGWSLGHGSVTVEPAMNRMVGEGFSRLPALLARAWFRPRVRYRPEIQGH